MQIGYTRSIPARAGEPGHPPGVLQQGGVYPRACGGTECVSRVFQREVGLSPRVRGNRLNQPGEQNVERSIPARAGEPENEIPVGSPHAVYPRACGGTKIQERINRLGEGLSPRVRGNLRREHPHGCGIGSIPARAGEPERPTRRKASGPVYPRACGGTGTTPPSAKPGSGLSPRVRGNLLVAVAQNLIHRSIPARAGEPPRETSLTPACAVYPRACGGTIAMCGGSIILPGLSPRVRGNRRVTAFTLGHRGSIPARAGEPHATTPLSGRRAVYPRACGGTAGVDHAP